MIPKPLEYVIGDLFQRKLQLVYCIKRRANPLQDAKKKYFLEILMRSQGIVKAACASTEIRRLTFYRWYADDKLFREEVDNIRREQMGDVEDRLFLAIANNEPWAIRMFLNRIHPKYRPKVENINVNTTRTLEDLLQEHEQQNPDRDAVQDTEQARPQGIVPLQPSAESLLDVANSEEFNSQSPSEGIV